MKSGILSLLCYGLYALGGGGMAVYYYIALQKFNENGGGLEGIGYVILFVLGLIVCAAGILGLILKGLHIGTGWLLFGLLCLLFDVICVGFVWFYSIAESTVITEAAPFLILTIPQIISLISNGASLKN